MTTILTKKKDTTGAPAPGDLTNSSGGAELAVNTFDKRLYTKDSGGTVVEIGTNPTDITTTTVDTTNLEVTNVKAKDGTAAATIADSTGKITVSTELAVDNLNLSGNTISSTDTNGNIVLAPNGSGDVQVDADTLRVGDSNANATLTTNGTGDLILNTNAGTNSSSITIQDAANGNIVLAPNGSGRVQVSGTSSNSGGIELFEDTDNGTNKVLLTVPASVASDVTATIPAATTTLAGLAVAQTFSVSQRGTVTTDNDGSFDMNATNNFLCTPTGGFTLTFTNITAGQSGNIILVNGSNYAITAAAATKVSATALATISVTGTYWLSYYSPDGTNVYVANTGALA